ncbi:MAG: hypothetical protein ACRD2T_03950, partial [Thermoanaerobaculia bacterium]
RASPPRPGEHTAHDGSVAPPGLHTMSVFAQYVPYAFRRGDWASRRTPMKGVFLCGASTHPGGSVIAINGRNAAMEVLGRARGSGEEGMAAGTETSR